tara:strand:- start:2250 stop:6455 length:4206 start_codon:yes stop_codon:yes gene_type:complete
MQKNIPEEKVDGIYYDNTGVRYTSVTEADLCDLVCEGNIDGLVSKEYVFDQTNSSEGDIGYAGVTIETLPSELCSVYWNETPVQDKDTSKYNFQEVDVTTSESLIYANGIPSQRIRTINEKLRGLEKKSTDASDYAIYYKYYKILNKDCSKITVNLKVGALGKKDRFIGSVTDPNPTYGQFLDSDLRVNVYYRPIYSSKSQSEYTLGESVKFSGTLTSPYARSVILDLPIEKTRASAEKLKTDFIGWEIRVHKGTVEPTTPDTKNVVFVDSIVEELEDSFMAPNTFIVRNKFNAEFFGKIPERAYDARLSKIKIPSNYNPITKTYTGHWDGTFSDEKTGPYGSKGLYWSDNPAWCFYDLITNKRYGLGKYIKTDTFDKWTLYEIAKYCDELVSDGMGGLEPRFTCNIIIQTREDAFKVINDMASVFRAIVYYSAGNLYAVQDALKQPIFQFTNANVENGDFRYSSTSAKVRHTVAVIRYNDKEDFYKPAVEYVEDVDSIRKYGIKEKSISAFGCTSRGQANRLGRWVLASESLETETCTFSTGHEGALLRPGDIIIVSDSNRIMTRRGGRVKSLTKTNNSQFTVVLDGELETLDSQRSYEFTVSTPSFSFDPAQVTLSDSNDTQYIRNVHIQRFTINHSDINYQTSDGVSHITVNGNIDITNFSTPDNLTWSILTTDIDNSAATIQERLNHEQKFRVINVREKEAGKYEVATAEYSEAKYRQIDEAVKYVNQVDFTVPQRPKNIQINSVDSIPGAPNTKVVKYSIAAPTNTNGLSYYAVYAKKGSGFGSGIPENQYLIGKVFATSNSPIGEFIPSTAGTYYFRVYSSNSLNQYSSSYREVNKQISNIQPIKDVRVHSLTLADNLRVNDPAESDPFHPASTSTDEYDGSTTLISWKTDIPTYEGANVVLDFNYKVTVFEGHQTTTPLVTYNNYLPNDAELSSTTFEFSLNKNYAANANNIKLVDRKYAFKVEAIDANNNSSSASSTGYDILYVDNPAPTKPASIQGMIDINNHIKIFNLDRPPDATSVYVFALGSSFSYSDYLDGDVSPDIKKINADVDVLEIDPSFKTDDLKAAHVAIAYIDDFDADVIDFAAKNGISFEMEKLLASRISDVIEIKKVTPEIIDLLGEGWKSWIKINTDGKWYGRGIKCVKDVTDDYDDYVGYVPFYCTRKMPVIEYAANGDVFVGYLPGVDPSVNTTAFTAGCLYHLPPRTQFPAGWYPQTYTDQIDLIGGHTSSNFTETRSDYAGVYPKGFKRFRVYFEKNKDPNKYWVMGMNVNNTKYYDTQLISDLGKFFTPTAGSDWDEIGNPYYSYDFAGGAKDALSQAKLDNPNKEVMIGGSDAYFNYHPAGFVQGFGGLPKTIEYFDIHLGHMVDNSYLKEAMFFVMATDQNEKNLDPDPPCN